MFPIIRRRHLVLAAASIITLVACSGSSDPDRSSPPPSASPTFDAVVNMLDEAGRVDIEPSGNRVILGAGALLDADPIEVQLDGTPRWIVPAGPSFWIAVLEDGSSVVIQVEDDGSTFVEQTNIELTADATNQPPLATSAGLSNDADFHDLFADPLFDTRIVATDDALIALSGPTDRYAHGVLGDDLEASAIEVATASNEPKVLVELEAPDVFEAVSPMIADVDDDGTDEVVVTVSNGDSGARVVAYSLTDGSIVAETDPIGQGNRWRNLLAVASIGPNGETEIIDVRTPHIGGILQFFRVEGSRMELVASASTYSTHSIGSRNLDLGIVSDANGDGRLDVVLPTQDMTELAVVTRDDSADGGTHQVGRVDLGGRLATNLAAGGRPGGVRYAAGLDDGVVLIWP